MLTNEEDVLTSVIRKFCGMQDEDISFGRQSWRRRKIGKGDYYNRQSIVCRDLGIVISGIFRVFYNAPGSDEEKNLFFFSENQFIVSFRSFILQYPCAYYIEAMEDSEILYISYSDLYELYEKNKAWEKFGRLLAEYFFNQSQGRTEELLFFSHEQRYLNMLKEHPNIAARVPAFQIASYLGVKNQSLSRIKKRIADKD